MVDFQSRSTRRTRGEDSDETDESESEGQADEQAVESQTDGFAYAVLSVGNGQSVETDESGAAVLASIEESGATVATRELIQPSYDGVQSTVRALVNRDDVDAIVTVGGTGVAPDDVTVDALRPLLDKRLPGFGERYRALGDDAGAIANRSTAGIIDTVPVFAVPNTVEGATTAVERLVVPEAATLARTARINTDE